MKQTHTMKKTRNKFILGCLCALFLTTNLMAQNRQITGVIKDAYSPLPGASISVKGTITGTITNADGEYSIQAAPNATLIVSFMGYKTVEVEVKNRATVNIELIEDVAGIDEVVVIGYGTVRKRDLTGSVSSVKSDVLLAAPSINAVTSLGGRIAGLDIAENVDPSKTTIRIRGNRSISGTNEPLFIIDGVQGGSYSDINPNDIESIEVLKDASSTAIYGYQGANGVIIITTKKGETGRMAISYNGFAGVEYLPQHPDYRTGDNWLEARRQAYRTPGLWSSSSDDRVIFSSDAAWNAFQNNHWTDFDDLMQQNSFFNSHNVTVTGGNDRTSARMSVGYYGNKTHYKKGKNERFTFRANIDHKVHDWITAGVVTQLTHNVKHSSPYEGLNSGGGVRVGTGVELGQAYDENGNVNRYPLGENEYISPLVNGIYSYSKANEIQGTNITTNGYINLTPIAGLTIRTSLAANFSFQRTGTYQDGTTTDRQQVGISSSSLTNKNTRFLNWDNVVTYNKTLGDHNFGVTGLTSWVKNIDETLVGSGTNQIVGSQLWWALNSNSTIGASSDYVQYQSFSYAGRFNYSYKGRYLLTGSMRWDGASRLTDKWDAFPSLALAWRISEESFMKSTTDYLDNLKLRVSYGTTGNSAIKPYGTQNGVVSFNNSGLAFQDNPVLWYVFKQTLGNTELGWEKTKQVDIGLDASFFGGRLTATIDYYDSKTSDLLLLRTLPSMMGQGVPTGGGRTNLAVFSMYQNIGKTRNRGLEVEITSINIKNKDFTWGSTLTFSTNKEKITGLIDGGDILHSQYPQTESLLLGRPIKSYRTHSLNGIWQSSEAATAGTYYQDANKTIPFEPGLINVKDLNGDYIIDANDEDYLGSQSPKWFAGLNNTFSYKDFDLSIYAYVRWGHWGENPLSGYSPSTGGSYKTYKYWTPENETNDFPRPNANMEFHQYVGYEAYNFIDRSFFRIKNISIGYNVPSSTIKKIGLEKLRVYATGTNLWYKSKHRFMKNFDPEGLRRQLVLGVNVDF